LKRRTGKGISEKDVKKFLRRKEPWMEEKDGRRD
jgi:hypothetical protein